MTNIEERCLETTKHIADKILMLRRANKLTQESFAEKIGCDRRTVARAEDGKHRPSAETMQMISEAFRIPVCYFYDNSVYKVDVTKSALIYEIQSKINIMSKNNLRKVNQFIDILD